MSKFVARWADGFVVVWRNLTWAEYKALKPRIDNSPFVEPMDIAMDVYRLVLIEGPDPRFVPAGMAAFVFKHQTIDNPFNGKFKDIDLALTLSRNMVMGDYLLAARGIIAHT